MPQCAQIEEDTNVCIQVIESDSTLWCTQNLGGTWVLNTTDKHISKEWIYYPDTNKFIFPQPFPSWTLNTETYEWEPPTPRPTSGGPYSWIEEQQEWVLKSTIPGNYSYEKAQTETSNVA